MLAPPPGSKLASVDLDWVERVSAALRQLLIEISPEIVATAEDFADEVVYIPVSALGVSPQRLPEGGGLAVCPKDIKPRWVTVPILYAYARWSTGLIHGVRGGQAGAAAHGTALLPKQP